MESESTFTFIVSFDPKEGKLRKEVWAYTAISFLAEMGGSLGLFTGISFLSVWDFGEFILDKYKLCRNYK